MLSKKYKEFKASSHSEVKDFMSMPLPAFHKKWVVNNGYDEDDDTKPHFKFGSLVDTIITAPHEYNDNFTISDVTDGNGKIYQIIEHVYKIWKNDTLILKDEKQLSDYIVQAYVFAKNIDYQSNWGETAVKNAILKKSDYFELLKTGKTIVSQKENMEAIQLREAALKDKYTNPYLVDTPGYKVIFQHMLTGNIDGIPVKMMPDILRFNEMRREISIMDLKAMISQAEFIANYRKYKYDSQLSYYKPIVEQNFPDWKVVECGNIVLDRQCQRATIFKYSDKALERAKHGYTSNSNYRLSGQLFNEELAIETKGWLPILKTLHRHKVQNQWEYSYDYIDNNGAVVL